MILIDAVYINITGGKILLDLLIEELEKQDLDIFYLLDHRVIDSHPKIANKNKLKYIKGSLINRLIFYVKYGKNFKKIFCFGNIPPPIKLDATVYTYFQNVLLANKKFVSIMWFLKRFIFTIYAKNSNFWIVQTPSVQKLLKNYLKLDKAILIFPFFKKFNTKINNNKKLISPKKGINFLYVSSGENYKNHKNLIKAFTKYNNSHKLSSLTLTVSEDYQKVCELINNCIDDGVKIINKGFIDKELLINEYKKADIFIFPSTYESFGLGLVEALQFNLIVLASNLDYVFDVITPSGTFNPRDVNSIYKSMIDYETFNREKSKIIVKNSLKEMVETIFLI